MRTWLRSYPNSFFRLTRKCYLPAPSGRRVVHSRPAATERIEGNASPAGMPEELCIYKATVAYDGTAYKGFQLQNQSDSKKITIQGEIEACLVRMFQVDRRDLRVQGAGRTDSGVHARGQVVSFCTSRREPESIWKSMNRLLPRDIRIVDLTEAPHTFNARHSATGKIYAYTLDIGPIQDPFMLRYSQHVWRPVSVQAMRAAASRFVGRHNFCNFANTFPDEVDPCKEIQSFIVTEAAPHRIRLEVEGSGFLYKMVRHMVGALVAVGTGLMDPSAITDILGLGSTRLPGDRRREWVVADAQGLVLEKVLYAEDAESAAINPNQ